MKLLNTNDCILCVHVIFYNITFTFFFFNSITHTQNSRRTNMTSVSVVVVFKSGEYFQKEITPSNDVDATMMQIANLCKYRTLECFQRVHRVSPTIEVYGKTNIKKVPANENKCPVLVGQGPFYSTLCFVKRNIETKEFEQLAWDILIHEHEIFKEQTGGYHALPPLVYRPPAKQTHLQQTSSLSLTSPLLSSFQASTSSASASSTTTLTPHNKTTMVTNMTTHHHETETAYENIVSEIEIMAEKYNEENGDAWLTSV